MKSEDGSKNLGGPYGSKVEAEKRLGEVEHFKHEDERGYRVVQEDLLWCIRDGEDVLITADEDEQVIRRAFEAMQTSRTWQDLHDDMAAAQVKRNTEIAKYLADELALRLKGTV